jgi:hypothetical protein
LLHNHIINIKKYFSFSGEVKDSVFFPFYFELHKRANPILPPYTITGQTEGLKGGFKEWVGRLMGGFKEWMVGRKDV